jgi:hypothetical protein
VPDHAVGRVDRLVNCRARESPDDHPDDRRDHPIGKILCQAFDCRSSDTRFIEGLGVTSDDARHRVPRAAQIVVLERIGNMRDVLVQAALGDQRAGEDGGADQSKWQEQKSALDDQCGHADNGDKENNRERSKDSPQSGTNTLAVASALQRRDQVPHPADWVAD